MITVRLTEDEILTLLKFTGPISERWPNDHTLANAVRKLDESLLAHEEGARN